MSHVIGIDLGTTNTVVAVERGGATEALQDASGSRLIPSVVSFVPNGTVMVGRGAKERRLQDARNTVYSVKRLIGRSWSSTEVQAARKRFPFEMREGPGSAALVVARGESYTLPEISAFVLRKAKQVAEAALGSPVDRAVITVPANFNDLQRAATKVAGRVAGLEVLRILNEPTAAALAYGYGRSSQERVAVYDFGGGTFDVTLLELSGNVFEVLATAGNTFLGGDDVDIEIAKRLGEQLLATHRVDADSSPEIFERLRAGAEELKHRLSSDLSATVEVPELGYGVGGRPLGLTVTMTRADLEALSRPIVERTFDVCRDALSIARMAPTDFDQVLLVGGSTRMPMVAKKVAEFFGREPLARLSPDEVVAMGAAIQGAALSGMERRHSRIPPPPRPAALGDLPGQSRLGVVMPRRSSDPPAPSHREGLEDQPRNTIPGLGQRGQAPRSVPPRRAVDTLPSVGDRTSERPPAGATRPRSRLPSVPPLSPLPGNRRSSPGDTTPSPLPSVEDSGLLRGHGSQARATIPDLPPAPPPTRPPTRPGRSALPPAEPAASLGLQAGLDYATVTPGLPPAVSDAEFPPLVLPTPGVPAPPIASLLPPVLVDVTPLTLAVETVAGFCDPVIQRNSPIPCEALRSFVTAQDQQTSVRVRVSQGESRRFGDNTLLGEIELVELRPEPRGKVEIAVTFALDTDGILSVRAQDMGTGREASARIRLVGLTEVTGDMSALAARHARLPTV